MFEMLSITLKPATILFDNKHYRKVDGVAMSSPLLQPWKFFSVSPRNYLAEKMPQEIQTHMLQKLCG